MFSYVLSIKGQIGCMGILLFTAWTYFSVKRAHNTAHKLFSALLSVTIVNVLFDMITVYTINHVHEIPLWFNHFLHIIYMASMAAALYFIYMYIRNLAYGDLKIKYYHLIPLAVAILAATFLRFDYVESPYGNYSWGPYATVAFVSGYVYFLLGIGTLIIRWKHMENKSRRAIAVSMLGILIVAVMQGIFPELLITNLGLTLINVALFYTVESPDALLIEQLGEERSVADSANRAKSIFLAQMSHEIRTPINAILGMNEMITRETKNDDIREYSANISAAGKTLLALINSILDFSKIEDGKMEILNVTYNTADLVNNLINSVSDRARSNGLYFEVEVDEKIPLELIGDDVRLTQVIMNLLTNAVKYTKKGTVYLTFREESRSADSVRLRVSVEDTGIGIRKEDMDNLFASFKRIDEEKNRNIEGTGLGMAIVDKLLRMMGSQIEVESEYGKGSVFSFSIEQKIANPEPIGDYRGRVAEGSGRQAKTLSFRAPKAKVLIVDDNAMNHKVAKNLLKLYGIVPDMAMSGAECIERVKTGSYHIICLDHMMPEMDGIETFDILRQEKLLPEGTIVLIMTANAIVGAKEMYLEKGFDDYIPKPIDISILEEKLRTYLPQDLLEEVPEQTQKSVGEDTGGQDSGSIGSGQGNDTSDIMEFDPAFDDGNPDGQKGSDTNEQMQGNGMNKTEKKLEKLKNIGIDTEAGILHSAGDRDFYLEILGDYTDSYEQKKNDFERLLKENNIHDYGVAAHALKSLSRTIGAKEFGEKAYAMEQAASRNDAEYIRNGHDAFIDAYEVLIRNIEVAIR
ncbi:MAG: response regulator [Lachnospiraceae bacterium]|nr:response regulator [Lachnospiraceae bacterium]